MMIYKNLNIINNRCKYTNYFVTPSKFSTFVFDNG